MCIRDRSSRTAPSSCLPPSPWKSGWSLDRTVPLMSLGGGVEGRGQPLPSPLLETLSPRRSVDLGLDLLLASGGIAGALGMAKGKGLEGWTEGPWNP